MLKITLPKSDRHPMVRIVVEQDGVSNSYDFDDTHKTVSLDCDPLVATVNAYFVKRDGKVDEGMKPALVNAPPKPAPAAPKPTPPVVPEPKPQPAMSQPVMPAAKPQQYTSSAYRAPEQPKQSPDTAGKQ